MDAEKCLNDRFVDIHGGLFAKVAKADVGEGVGNLIAQGYDIMAWADPFYPDPAIPPSVMAAMLESLKSGFPAHYTMPIGDTELRRELARKIKRANGMDVDPSRNVLVTPGSDSGLLYAMMPFISPGDEILVPDPSYPSNSLDCRILGGVPVPVPLMEEDNYQPDIAEFERRVTPRTRMLLVTHPNNPTTTVWRRKAVEEICAFAKRHDLVLVSDQAFEDHIYDDIEFATPAALPGMFERTVTVFSLSKGLGLSGLRVGYIVTNDRFMDALYGAAVNVLGATNTLAQAGALAALRDPAILKANYEILERRRRLAHEVFSTIPGVKARPSESGILSWLNIERLGTSAEVAAWVLEHAHVSINEGTPYGLQGSGHVRIVHGCFRDDDRAVKAFIRIKGALTELAAAKGIR